MMTLGQDPGNNHEISNEDTGVDPALKALGYVGQTTSELDRALRHADATFDAVAKVQTFLNQACT